MSNGALLIDDNGKPVLGLQNDATGQVIPVHVGAVVTGVDGKQYAKLDVNASVTPPSGAVSTLNSTTTLLGANGIWTGASESGLAYGSISVEVYSDQASATGGLVVRQSQDGTNWDIQNTYNVVAATAFQATVNIVAPFFEVKYTNGAVAQGTFRLQTVKLVAASPSAGVSNQRVNAQSGDFVANSITDLATLLTLSGTPTDANTVNSLMGRLTKIRDLLNATLPVSLATLPALAAGTALIGAIMRSVVTVLNQASAAQTATGNSGDLTVGQYTEISIDINVTANSGTSQTLTFFWDRKGADGNYYPLWQSAQQTTTNNQISTSIGAGMAYAQSLGTTGRLRWVLTGTTPSYTFSASVIGK